VWLVVLELTVLRVAWTFNLDFAHYEMAGVIWVIGWSMVALAVLVRLPLAWVGAFGVVVMAAHNLLDGYIRQLVPALGDDLGSALWKIAYVGFFAGPVSLGPDGPHLIVLYSLVPWVGVMAAGYAFGRVLALEPARRDRACLWLGLSLTALFLVLRGFNLYGDPRPWSATLGGPGDGPPMPALFAFLNTTKYPASLSFLLMTLGPTIAVVPLFERWRGALAGVVSLFGRVPFFFYVLHIPLIHVLAMAVSLARLGEISGWLFANHPMAPPPPPDGYPWSLPLLYLVWAIALVPLYIACRWYADLKSRRRDWWLKFV
jgi:uncharacterized membrane protein